METIKSISILGYIIPFLTLLTIVVFIHEMGHFLVGRWCGVKVETFSVGFGRAILSRTDKHGTEWKLGWIPLGGYVKFYGDENAASTPSSRHLSDTEKTLSLHHKPLLQKSAVVAAGPIANFILGIVLFTGVFATLGERIIVPVIGEVYADSAAQAAGFMPQDIVLAIDGNAIESFNDMAKYVSVNAGVALTFTVQRNGEEKTLIATPAHSIERDRFGNEYPIGRLGVTASQSNFVNDDNIKQYNLFTALQRGVKETYFITEQSAIMIARVITGRESTDNLGGPVRIAQISGQMANEGILPFIHLMAILSISIGFINLFPLPVLDGGHLLFYAIEGIIRRPIPEKFYEYAMRFGSILLFGLFIFITWKDIGRIGIFG